MSIISGANAVTGAGAVSYQIENSLRFNSADSAYLNRTPASASNRRTFTWSAWVKRGTLGSYTTMFSGVGGGSGPMDYISFDTNNKFLISSFNGVDYIVTTLGVFRDPSAWYHLVVAVDTTQATSTNRIKLYVNGVNQTDTGGSYPTQNYDTQINNNVIQYVGYNQYNYWNGYLADINFIDGSALDPTSFGEYNTDTGVWQPKAYTGSYGTNGFYLPMTQGESYSGYFSSAYVNTPTDASFALTTNQFAIEWWEYRTSTSNVYPVWGGKGQATYDPIVGYLDSGNNVVYMSGNGSSWGILGGFNVGSVNVGQWNHFLLTRDSSNVVRGFKNGVLTSNTNIGASSIYMSANGLTIGRAQSSNYFLGYVSNARVCIGSIPTAYQTSSTTNGTTIFTPSTTQLTTTSQGATSSDVKLLTMQNSTIVDNSANAWSLTTSNVLTQEFSPFYLDVTDDASGNGNNWTPNNLNLSTSGSGADIMVDTPTPYGTDTGAGGEVRGNYATLNPLDEPATYAAAGSAANGNLDFSVSNDAAMGSTISVSSGKWYWEMTVVSGHSSGSNTVWTAITSITPSSSNKLAWQSGSGSRSYATTGLKYNENTSASYGNTYTNGDVIGCALDLDNGKVYWSKNGTFQASGDPVAGTNAAYTGLTGSWMPEATQNGAITAWNFGQRPFAYTAPSGFASLCTTNLPDPTIADGSQYMNVRTYDGNGGTQTVSGYGFQPDLIWIKSRSNITDHIWMDVLRGNYGLASNDTGAEYNNDAYWAGFTSDGFTVEGGGGFSNGSGRTYVAWGWDAGGSGVTNTAGTITSTVSANTTAGFSIVTYTGTGSGTPTVGHGLGVAPSMIMVKSRSNVINWGVGHVSAGWSNAGLLNATNSFGGSSYFASTAPTSTVFSIQDTSVTNIGSATYVAYCFAAVSGYSAFGSYTGNGSTDGPFVYLGFRPRYVLWKGSSFSSNWRIADSARNTYNVASANLEANLSDAEGSTSNTVDFLSNGFKIRGTGGDLNTSSGTILYAAFAENPFKYALAR